MTHDTRRCHPPHVHGVGGQQNATNTKVVGGRPPFPDSVPGQQHVVEVDIGKVVVIHAAGGHLFHWHAGLAGCTGCSHLRLLVLGLAHAVPDDASDGAMGIASSR